VDTEPVAELSPLLKEDGFAAIETEKRKFIAIGLSYLCGKAKKINIEEYYKTGVKT
jgi:hypothetical protein